MHKILMLAAPLIVALGVASYCTSPKVEAVQDKVTICHYDRNDTGPNAGPHTIEVAAEAVEGHLKNHVKKDGYSGDDSLGECPSTPTPTPTSTNTPMDTVTPTFTPTDTSTPTPSSTAQETLTASPTATNTESFITETPTPTSTNTSVPFTVTETPSATVAPTETPTSTATEIVQDTPTSTASATPEPSVTERPNTSPEPTASATPSDTVTVLEPTGTPTFVGALVPPVSFLPNSGNGLPIATFSFTKMLMAWGMICFLIGVGVYAIDQLFEIRKK